MLRFLKVTGDSLYPLIREGDFVLVSKIPFLFGAVRQGDTVAFSHPELGTLIKRVDWVSADRQQFFVVGTNEWSVDSRQFGPVERKRMLGKIIWHIRKPER